MKDVSAMEKKELLGVMQQTQTEAMIRSRHLCRHMRLLCPNCGEMHDNPNPHPEHAAMEGPRCTNPSQPIRASFWLQWKRERACRKSGGHWWHPIGMIDWFCCQCGKETDGMPKDGGQ